MPQDESGPDDVQSSEPQSTQSADRVQGNSTLLARYLLVFDAARDARLARTDVAVLMAILDHMNSKTGLAFPSLDTIAAEAKVNRRTASRSIDRLVDTAHLTRIRGTGRRSNGYRMPARSRGEFATATTATVVRSRGEFATTTASPSEGKSTVVGATVVRSSGELTPLTCLEPEKDTRTDALASADGALSGKRSKSSQARTTFDAWLESLDEDVDAIAADDPLFEYAETIGLPRDFLVLAWKVFSLDHENSPAQSADWPAVFRRHVRKDYFRLWFVRGDSFPLTTRGKQAAIEHDMRYLIVDEERA
jgi:hypothetical protein